MKVRTMWSRSVGVLVVLALTAAVAVATEGPSFELAVRLDKTFGSTPGTLTFRADSVEFEAAGAGRIRSWRYEDLRQVQVRSARRIDLLTYEDQGWLKLGADRRYQFSLAAGEVPPELVAFLLRRVERPLLLAVIPPPCCTTGLKVAVKHERQGKGSEGVLLVHHGALIYDTQREGEARYWRFTDLDSVLLLDRDRLQVTARENARLRPFVFQLKSELPEGFYDALWAEVNGRSWWTGRPAGAITTGGGSELR